MKTLLRCTSKPLYMEYKLSQKLDIKVNDVVLLDGKPDKDGLFVRDALRKLMFIPFGTLKFRVVRR